MFERPVMGHSLRGERYRYIYYQNHDLEELYNHQKDPNEFDNLAYNDKYAEIIDSFRKELPERIDSSSIENIMELSEGYVINDGKVENTKFTTMEDLPLRESRRRR